MFVGETAQAGVTAAEKSTRSANECLPRRETVQELRSGIARVEEQCRQLLGPNARPRLLRSVDSLAQAARIEAASAVKMSNITENHANADVFLAQLGYNVQEQLRLMRHIEATRPVIAASAVRHQQQGRDGGANKHLSGEAESSPALFATPTGPTQVSQLSVDAFLHAKRNEALTNLVTDAHAATLHRERETATQAVAALWESRKHELADAIGLRNLLDSTSFAGAGSTRNGRGSHASHHHLLTSSSSAHGARAGTSLSLPPFAARRATKLAAAVSSTPPTGWLPAFATIAAEAFAADVPGTLDRGGAAAPVSSGLAEMWATLNRVLSFQQRGGSSSLLRVVAGSRFDLEMRGLVAAFEATQGGASNPPALDELRMLHVDKALEMFRAYEAQVNTTVGTPLSDTARQWQVTLRAMRCGRYDAAAVTCPEPEVAALLEHVHSINPALRNSTELPAKLTEAAAAMLAALNTDVPTSPLGGRSGRNSIAGAQGSEDRVGARTAVLLVLLAGDAGPMDDETVSTLLQKAVVNVATSLDDLVWLRLSLVRAVLLGDAFPGTGRRALSAQTLEGVQRQLLSDQQQLLVSVGGNTLDMVDVLNHALLFGTSIRMLSESPETAVDAAHVALVLDHHKVLNVAPFVENQFDVAACLRRHAAMLARLGPSSTGYNPITAVFAYFEHSDNVPVFVELCATTPAFAAELFGRAGGKPGELLVASAGIARGGSAASSAGVPESLVRAALQVADASVHNGSVLSAIDVLVSLHAVGRDTNDRELWTLSLERALALLNPSLSHHILKAYAGSPDELLQLAPAVEAVLQALSGTSVNVPAVDAAAFEQLRSVATVVLSHGKRDWEGTLNAFFSLPFVPLATEQVDAAAQAFDNSTAEVRAVVPRCVSLAVEALLETAHEVVGTDTKQAQMLRASAFVVSRWLTSWKASASGEASSYVRQLLGRFPA